MSSVHTASLERTAQYLMRFLLCLGLLVSFVSPCNTEEPYYKWYELGYGGHESSEESGEMKNPLDTNRPCPLGHYRELGSDEIPGGLREEGCYPCPAGTYGASHHLQNSQCSGKCPKGTFGQLSGLTSIEDCTPCPRGTFGETAGLTTEQCSGRCSDLNGHGRTYYSKEKGLTSRAGCKPCPPGYRGGDCYEPLWHPPDTRRTIKPWRDRWHL